MRKYLILDFGKVLAYPITHHWHITPTFLKLIDISKIDINRLEQGIANGQHLLDQKLVTLEEEYNMFVAFYDTILKECQVSYDKKAIETIAYNRVYNGDGLVLYEGVIEELQTLKDKYTLIMLTDNWPCVLKLLDDLKIAHYFSKIYVSSIYGVKKEDGLFFDYPLSDFNIAKGEALFIDDNEKLLDVAANKGLDVLLMDREDIIEKAKYPIIHNLMNL